MPVVRSRTNMKNLISLAKIGNKNPQWKGKKVGLTALHVWVRSRLVKPDVCSDCQEPKSLDLANISQKYKRDLSDWEWLCRRCHMKKDGRMKNLLKGGGRAWSKTEYSLKGENNPNWKGGITYDDKAYQRTRYQKMKSGRELK